MPQSEERRNRVRLINGSGPTENFYDKAHRLYAAHEGTPKIVMPVLHELLVIVLVQIPLVMFAILNTI